MSKSILYQKIKQIDKFGHQTVLNFNKKGNYHNTFLGGLISILVNIFVFIYIWGLIRKVVFFEDDSISTVTKFGDPMDLGEILLNDTNYIPTFLFTNLLTNQPYEYSEIEKYLDVEFLQIE